VSITKKPRQSSTRPGTQVVGSMLLGEHLFVRVLNRVLSLFLDSTVVGLLEGEEDEGDDDDAALDTRRWVVVVLFVFLLLFLGTSFDLSLPLSFIVSGCRA
jgi:hypothetical protein